ncbi:MAG: hypothetical protein Q7T87_09875 [Polaromonas sp.]|nr:hypothetical protein [Polaromonas sp.]
MIIDEMLPCDFSPFRNLEYSHYLSFFHSSVLVSTEGWHSWISNMTFEQNMEKDTLSVQVKAKIKKFEEFDRFVPSLAYITFLNNAYQALPLLEERQLPFILQLYPGGGFELHSEKSDEMLRAVAQSPLCRKIITTQNISTQYLIDRANCPEEKIEFIYGGVYNTRHEFDFSRDKKLFGRDKETIDICFVAHRYGDDVKKKGYDQFVAVARAFAISHPHMRFHVVGDYTPDQIPLGPAAERMTFHGRVPNTFFAAFYPQMDMILSVNRPADGLKGAFDGFPTGACMEAGFRGVLNLISDPLNLNVAFTDGKDVVLLDEDTDRTIARIHELVSDPARMYQMSYANWSTFHDVFDTDKQLWARTEVVTAQLLARETLIVRPPVKSALALGVNAGLIANLKDTERRHDNLLLEYYKLAEGFEARGRALEERAQTVAPAPTPSIPRRVVRKCRSLASRIKQKIKRTLFSQ